MINLQNSKKLVKTYDNLMSTGFRSKTLSKNGKVNQSFYDNTHSSGKVLVIEKESFIEKKFEEPQKPKESSLIVNIQFHQNQRLRHNAEIKMRRRILTSSEKLYNQKRSAYSNYIREVYQRINEELTQKNNFITVGSHAIQRIEYSHSTETEMKCDSILKQKIRRQLHAEKNNGFAKQRAQIEFELNKVIGQRSKKIENPILPSFQFEGISRNSSLKAKINCDSFEENPHEKGESKLNKTTISEFIPIKRSSQRKEPFVFGLSDKQASEKLKDKNIVYLDFLWKVNYSNGLYIRATPEETTYKAYIGSGNNSCMVKGILRRRYWWTITDKAEDCNFAWTQLKINFIFKHQNPNRKDISSEKTSSQRKESDSDLALLKAVDLHAKLFNHEDFLNWHNHFQKNKKSESLISQRTYLRRIGLLTKKFLTKVESSKNILIHNHLEQNYFIGNKKALYYNMRKFYEIQSKNVFDVLPVTYHIAKGIDDPQFQRFLRDYEQCSSSKKDKNIWIMKPGENSNRGNGITVCHCLDDVKFRLKCKEKNGDGSLRTFILQKYLQRPLLYKGRKFDLRHYILITCFNGSLKAYWYPQGYVRTASALYSLKRGANLFVHLTNDAVQKHSDQYGKYQKGNKLSYEKFQSYLNKSGLDKNAFYRKILPEMKQIALNAVRSTFLLLDEKRKEHNFQLLGLDFMIDDTLKPWLIEVNTNPCLELSSPLLARLIPSLIQNTLRICVDPFFPPPQVWPSNKKMYFGEAPLEQNLFELMFDESVDGAEVYRLYEGNYNIDCNIGKIEEDDELYENDGTDEWEAIPNETH